MYIEHPTDQQIYDAGLTRAGYKLAYQAQQRTRRLEEQRAANTVTGVERSGSRFYPGGVPASKLKLWQEQQRANAPVEAPQPPLQPPQVVTPAKPKEDFAAAKAAYHAYFKADNGYEKGKAFVDFGIALGEIPSNACGLTGGQAQADRISAILHDRETSAFKYDRERRIEHVQQVPQ
jgi:hypothetical protein